MFTGIVEEIGEVSAICDDDVEFTLTITANKVLRDVTIGDSIAVNGVCLTVTSHTFDEFTANAVPETLERTNLGRLAAGDFVNLERSATPETRLGGHYMQGHVDATGVIESLQADNEAVWVKTKAPHDLMRYIVSKGYITIDGTSLTVVDVGPDWFTVTLVPHTQDHITLPRKAPGDLVNLEADIIAKYVEKIVAANLTGAEQGVSHAIG